MYDVGDVAAVWAVKRRRRRGAAVREYEEDADEGADRES